MVMAANLGTVGWLGGVFLSVLVFLSQYSELDCEEIKLEVRLFDKQWSLTPN